VDKWDKIFVAVVVVLVITASFFLIPNGCSDWDVEKMEMQLDLAKAQHDYNESMLDLIESIYDLEKMNGDFTNHAYWVRLEVRTHAQLTELSADIPILKQKLSECNGEGDSQ